MVEKGSKTWGLHPYDSAGEWELKIPITSPWMDQSNSILDIVKNAMVSVSPIMRPYFLNLTIGRGNLEKNNNVNHIDSTHIVIKVPGKTIDEIIFLIKDRLSQIISGNSSNIVYIIDLGIE